jgi:hypothetical protein
VIDFEAARTAVATKLRTVYANDRAQPRVLPYGWDTGTAWAPALFWDGIMGAYVWLVDKESGDLTAKSFNEFLDMPDPSQVGPWPPEEDDE